MQKKQNNRETIIKKKSESRVNQYRTNMNQNNIIKLNLEPRIADMKRENLSERDIAKILSKEMNQKITKSAVHRYLAGNVRLCQEVVEVNNKMKVKVLEAELDTIEARRALIDRITALGDKAEESGDIKTALYAVHLSTSALDSLDKRIGIFTDKPDVQVNIQVNQRFDTFMNVVLQECDAPTKARISQKMRERF